MGENRHSRGLFPQKKHGDETVMTESFTATAVTGNDGQTVHDLAAKMKKHSRNEHLAEAGALLSGAAALFEKHQAKKDPQNAHKHHIGEAVAGAVAVGSAAYAIHECHDKKDAKKAWKQHH